MDEVMGGAGTVGDGDGDGGIEAVAKVGPGEGGRGAAVQAGHGGHGGLAGRYGEGLPVCEARRDAGGGVGLDPGKATGTDPAGLT
ncbi:hypothetical protein [Streptomyces decoyicus]|uniref:hypothetical protein n=1 Tax=Streptomyces decoyicus TaxID=249567 RepID=UPI0013652C7C|nr:hypothetical protein K7C20_01675 [Streptomyces decoyicus]